MVRAFSGVLLFLLLLSAVPEAAAQRPPSGETIRTLAISGNIRYHETGQGADMLRVDLKRFTGENVATAFTGANGEFEFPGLGRGTYILTVAEEKFEQIRERVELVSIDRRGVLLYLKKTDDPKISPPGETVSARELSLPPKAVEEYRKGYKKFHEGKDPQGSLSYFQRAVEILPDYYEAHYEMGLGHLQMGDQEKAEKAFQHSIEHGKAAYAGPYFGLAAVFCNQQKFKECEKAARQGLAVDANAWQGHYQLARGLVGLNRLPQAETHLREVIKQQPEFAEPYLTYANIYIRRQDLPSLMRVLDEYLRLEPAGPMSESVRQTRDAVARDLEQINKRRK